MNGRFADLTNVVRSGATGAKLLYRLLATSKLTKDYTHAFATWNVGPYTKNVLFKFEPGGLSVEVFTIYDPKVGRSNYLFATPLTKQN